MATFGATELPPSRRPPVPCQRCNGTRFVRVVPREISKRGGKGTGSKAAPMGLAYKLRTSGILLSWERDAQTPDIDDVCALLETYVCAGCGFIEWYCQAPDEIPIGPEHMSEVIDYASEDPYR
jgi:hypothetical protein